MIGSLRGALLERYDDGEALVEVGGIGYRVQVTPTTAVGLGSIGDTVLVHVHHHIREDAQTLFGFATRDERIAFEALISAHGVGPSMGMAILSVHGPGPLRRILADDDIDALCLVPGVGKKTAQRLLVELKSKLDLGDIDLRAVGDGSAPTGGGTHRDVREALAGLGFGSDEIASALADLPDDGDTATLVKAALRSLGASR